MHSSRSSATKPDCFPSPAGQGRAVGLAACTVSSLSLLQLGALQHCMHSSPRPSMACIWEQGSARTQLMPHSAHCVSPHAFCPPRTKPPTDNSLQLHPDLLGEEAAAGLGRAANNKGWEWKERGILDVFRNLLGARKHKALPSLQQSQTPGLPFSSLSCKLQ